MSAKERKSAALALPSSTPSSPSSPSSRLDEKTHRITVLLAAASYHLPGNNCFQDWFQYMRNNHPIFGLFCHHRLHPLRFGQRLVCLVGSIAFGLAATNCVYLYYEYNHQNIDEVLVRIHVQSNSTVVTEKEDSVIEITQGMVALWTFGGVLHSVFDLVIWRVSACACCLPGGSFAACGCCQKCGSYIVVVVVAALTAVATFAVAVRASLVARQRATEEGVTYQDFSLGSVSDFQNFRFLVGYGVEIGLALLIYYPIVGTLFFSGVLGCGRLPMLGGRPRAIWKEKQQRRPTQTTGGTSDEDDVA